MVEAVEGRRLVQVSHWLAFHHAFFGPVVHKRYLRAFHHFLNLVASDFYKMAFGQVMHFLSEGLRSLGLVGFGSQSGVKVAHLACADDHLNGKI
jgi:hypothetical protein